MSRFAFQALMLWDDPANFSCAENHKAVQNVINTLLNKENAHLEFDENEHALLTLLVANSMEAVGSAIENNVHLEAMPELVETLQDLVVLSNEIAQTGNNEMQ